MIATDGAAVVPGPGSPAGPAVRAHGLTKKFGDFVAVRDVTIGIERGEIYGFLGPNGSGKSTTIRMLTGLLRPTAGSISVLGIDARVDPDAVKSRSGYMSQRFSLYMDMTVRENLVFYGAVYGLAGRRLEDRIRRVLESAGLSGLAGRRPGELSTGHRQRLALGAAMLHDPAILFLDEPTSGVDPTGRRRFWDLIYAAAERGTTVMVTTHFMDEAEHCSRIAFISRGEIIARGTPGELKERVGAPPGRSATLNDVFIGLARRRGPVQEVVR